MSARQPRFELVRTSAGWHARFRAANGQIVWQTEVYTRRGRAERAVRIVAESFVSTIRTTGGLWWRIDPDDGSRGLRGIEVREVDER